MKRWKKILLGVLAALVLALADLCLWQRNNIQALYTFLSQDSEDIAQGLEDKRKEHHQAIQDALGGLEVEVPTTEQSDAILSGQVTPEEVKEALGITEELEKPEDPEGPTAEDLVRRCVAELYACKVDIMAVLGELKQAAVDQWLALSPEEQTSTKLKEIGFAGLNECYRLEAEVDDQVREILGRYREQLKQAGATSPFWTICGPTTPTRRRRKAYYLDKYLN